MTLPARVKWKIIALMETGTHSKSSIARIVKCDRASVRRIYARYIRTGDIRDLPKSGRPPHLSTETLEDIFERHRRATSKQLVGIIESETGQHIAASTIRTWRERLGFYGTRRRIPRLRHHHFVARLEWCRNHKNDSFWNVIFADESRVYLRRDTKLIFIRRGEDPPERDETLTDISVCIWGAVSLRGKSQLYITSKTIDSKRYTNILERHLLPMAHRQFGSRYRFLQDNARPHTSGHTTWWLVHHNVPVLSIPPYSPDINAIEKVWKWVKDYVEELQPRTRQDLIRGLEEAWEYLPQHVINNNIHHVHHVLPEIIERLGGRFD